MLLLRRLRALFVVAFAMPVLAAPFDDALEAVMEDVVAWRHHLHQNPELSNREFETAAMVAEHLRALGFDEVHTGLAHTGVVGILRGGQPGGTVALRADMDALPVKEMTGLPYASTVMGEYLGESVPVMHACGHDAHVAMLMGAASVLAAVRDDIRGTVALVFQPAEEGPPPGEPGGAKMMLDDGFLSVAENPSAIFGLHVWPLEAGELLYRPQGFMAAADMIRITVEGVQTHGSSPWKGVDPIVVSAQIINALQTIPSRQLDVTAAPAVLTIGRINGGLRGNIIPDRVEMQGTLRNFDNGVRDEMLARIERTVTDIASSFGATATFEVEHTVPVTWNDPDLVQRMLPSLERSSALPVRESSPIMGAEDFSYYQKEIPGFFYFLGINAPGVSADEAPTNHSPYFTVNDAALETGVRSLANLALDYLASIADEP